MIKPLCYFEGQNYDFSASLKSFSNFWSVSWSPGYQPSSNFEGLGRRSDCNALLTEWRKSRVKTRRQRHEGTRWPFTFTPQEDRVVLPITEELKEAWGETCSSLARRLEDLEDKESWKSTFIGHSCTRGKLLLNFERKMTNICYCNQHLP